MAVSSPADISAGCRHLASAFSPGAGITPAYPGGRERHIPALPDAGDSPETGAGESGAVECPGCTGSEVGEPAAERKTAALTPVYAHSGPPGWTERAAGNHHSPQCGIPFYVPHRYPGYYRHISKAQLKRHVERFVPEQHLRQVIHQYIDYSVEDGGEFYTPPSGIPRSPFLGASFLWYVDGGFERERGLFYVRYMDDFLFLSQRRWPVRRAISRLHQYFDDTGFECHPDKTTVGRVEKGFDWLGVWFDERGPVGIAPRALENHRTRCLRLEEQARRCGLSEERIQAWVQSMRRGGWSGPMVSSVQRTEVADVASLFIGCDMKKRSACNIVSGVIALCLGSAGHCGLIELAGTAHATAYYTVEVTGSNSASADAENVIGVSCALCKGYNGPCRTAEPQDVRIVSRLNVVGVVYDRYYYNGYAGFGLRWRTGDGGKSSTVRFTGYCTNAANPEWDWVDMHFHRDRRYPESDLYVTATNMTNGVTLEHNWGRGSTSWAPGWGAVVLSGPEGAPARVSASYPETVELRGRGARARILYDITGNAPIIARIDNAPAGLSCMRTSDGLRVDPGVAVTVGHGESISCTNNVAKVGVTAGTLTLTAMVR